MLSGARSFSAGDFHQSLTSGMAAAMLARIRPSSPMPATLSTGMPRKVIRHLLRIWSNTVALGDQQGPVLSTSGAEQLKCRLSPGVGARAETTTAPGDNETGNRRNRMTDC